MKGKKAPQLIQVQDWKRESGSKANSIGKLFEEMFHYQCKRIGIAVTQIKNGCKFVGANKVVPVKAPFDWVCSYRGQTALIDTKSLNQNNFPASAIEKHQIDELLKHEVVGIISGYVIWLRKSNRVFFIPSSSLAELVLMKGTSLNEQHSRAILLGTSASIDTVRIFDDSRMIHEEPEPPLHA